VQRFPGSKRPGRAPLRNPGKARQGRNHALRILYAWAESAQSETLASVWHGRLAQFHSALCQPYFSYYHPSRLRTIQLRVRSRHRDQDCIYGAVVMRRIRAMGIRDKPTATASPWQNGFAERLIGSIRRECTGTTDITGQRTSGRCPSVGPAPASCAAR
jgi:hypothetical protein